MAILIIKRGSEGNATATSIPGVFAAVMSLIMFIDKRLPLRVRLYGCLRCGGIFRFHRRLIVFPLTLLTDNDLGFPNPENSDAQGLLAIGGDLSPQRILAAYQQGIFPWFEPGTPILWWSPHPRLILKPNRFKLSRSLKKTLKKLYSFTIDEAFAEVITACSQIAGRRNHTWITREMREAYTQLHQMGYAHSFEVWSENNLIGGLYGLSLGHAFFGESMFHCQRDASKLAMYHLCHTLATWQFDFVDCQLPTAHLQSLGAEIISRQEFLRMLAKTLEYPTRQGKWALP